MLESLKPIFSALLMTLTFAAIGCSTNSESSRIRALFDTREEAAKAAKNFNCNGAHKMGDKWMPCKSHDAHGEGKSHEKNGEHHH
tara:strand:- start:701 stop:955 length:255 start_codon:yes stop_codon:yes gene_type:complete